MVLMPLLSRLLALLALLTMPLSLARFALLPLPSLRICFRVMRRSITTFVHARGCLTVPRLPLSPFHTLSLEDEFAVLEAAYEAGVKAPRPYGYIPDLSGREAFVMERLEGDTIGRRIVRKEELAAARAALPVQMAEELAKIHAILPER